MAPLYLEDGNDYYYEEDEASTATASTSATSLSSSSSEDCDGPIASPLRTPAAKRSVSFSAGAAVHLGAVISIEEYSEAEKTECWYQAEELRLIRKDVKDTVALMNQGASIDGSTRIDGNNMSIRGLEGKTKSGKRYRRETRLASLAAVFDEQTLQEMDGVTDPVLIAIAYSEYAYPMQVAACQRASIYQKEALEIYESSEVGTPVLPSIEDRDHNKQNMLTTTVPEEKISPDSSKEVLSDELSSDKSFDAKENEIFMNDGGLKENNEDSNLESKESVELEDDLLIFQNRLNNRRYNNIGALRMRDRLACLLPASASNSRRPIMSTLRVVHV